MALCSLPAAEADPKLNTVISSFCRASVLQHGGGKVGSSPQNSVKPEVSVGAESTGSVPLPQSAMGGLVAAAF